MWLFESIRFHNCLGFGCCCQCMELTDRDVRNGSGKTFCYPMFLGPSQKQGVERGGQMFILPLPSRLHTCNWSPLLTHPSQVFLCNCNQGLTSAEQEHQTVHAKRAEAVFFPPCEDFKVGRNFYCRSIPDRYTQHFRVIGENEKGCVFLIIRHADTIQSILGAFLWTFICWATLCTMRAELTIG